MSQEVITALIAAGAAALSSVATYFGLRLQSKDARRKDKERARQELGTAELSYLEKMQEMLVDAGQRLITAEANHTQREIGLERDKYVAQEALKRQEMERQRLIDQHKHTVQTLNVLNDEQGLEILKYIDEQRLFHIEIHRLTAILIDANIPVPPPVPPLPPPR